MREMRTPATIPVMSGIRERHRVIELSGTVYGVRSNSLPSCALRFKARTNRTRNKGERVMCGVCGEGGHSGVVDPLLFWNLHTREHLPFPLLHLSGDHPSILALLPQLLH